jgi:hypothetical protein
MTFHVFFIKSVGIIVILNYIYELLEAMCYHMSKYGFFFRFVILKFGDMFQENSKFSLILH